MNNFQERLQDLLTEHNISRLQLAKIIDVSSTTVNGYFNNNYFPNIKIAIKMVKYFNCSLDYLFGFSDIENNNNRNNRTFIENFNSLLKLSNKSISKALKDMNMSEYNYYRWKAGIFPKTVNLLSIAKYFDCSIDYLVGRSDNF